MYEENNNFIEFDPDALCEQDNPVSESKPAPSMDTINNTVAKMFANAGITNCNYKEDHEYIKSPKKAEGKADTKGSTSIEITADTTADDIFDSLSDAEKKPKKWEKVEIFLFTNSIYAQINDACYVWVAQEGVYKLLTLEVVDDMIRTSFEGAIKLSDTELKNVKRQLYTDVRCSCPKMELAKGVVPFADGDYLLEDGTFLEPSPERAVLSRLPHNKPTCDVAPEFVVDSLTDWADGDEETRKLLVQVIAFVLTGQLDSIQQCVLLLGDKQNGKTMFQRLLEYIAGSNNCSHLSMKELSERFKSSGLVGMRLNACDELNSKYIEDTEKFKQLTGQGAITIEKKGKDPVSYLYDGVMVFASNDMPRIKDDTGAVLRRLCICSFTHTFEKNDTFRKEMVKPENIEGYIHLALKEARVLYKEEEGFVVPAKSLPLYEEYKVENDVFGGWLNEVAPEDDIIGKPIDKVYHDYKDYAEDAGCGVMKKITFGKHLRNKLGLKVEQKWITLDDGTNSNNRVYVRK